MKGIAAKERKDRKEKPMQDIMKLCDVVRQTAYDIHVYHGHGHLEKVYENALANRLRKIGLNVLQQHPLTVYHEDGAVIGEYFADLFVDNQLIIELKAAKACVDEHVAQILGYLKSSHLEHGLLINFGSYRFEIKKFVLSEQRSRGKQGRIGPLISSLFTIFAFFRG